MSVVFKPFPAIVSPPIVSIILTTPVKALASIILALAPPVSVAAVIPLKVNNDSAPTARFVSLKVIFASRETTSEPPDVALSVSMPVKLSAPVVRLPAFAPVMVHVSFAALSVLVLLAEFAMIVLTPLKVPPTPVIVPAFGFVTVAVIALP